MLKAVFPAIACSGKWHAKVAGWGDTGSGVICKNHGAYADEGGIEAEDEP